MIIFSVPGSCSEEMQLNTKTQRLARIAPLAVIESDALRLLAFDRD